MLFERSTTTRSDGIDDRLRRIEAEYLEMPGLTLTRPQIQRLWHLESHLCDSVLDRLVGGRFLRQTARGAYVLARD